MGEKKQGLISHRKIFQSHVQFSQVDQCLVKQERFWSRFPADLSQLSQHFVTFAKTPILAPEVL
jgi:hypothetical protein